MSMPPSNGQIGTNGPSVTIDQVGDYKLTVTDEEGCSAIRNINIKESDTPTIQLSRIDPICPGDTIAVAVLEAYPTYHWSTGDTTQTAIITKPGDYSVSVANEVGCNAAIHFTVKGISNPMPEIKGESLFCEGDFTELEVGDGFTEYIWSTGEVGRTIKLETTTNISVTVTDDLGCQGVATMEVTEIPTPVIQISGQQVLCEGSTLILDAGEGYANYTWSNGETGHLAIIEEPGTYVVEVNSFEGCSDKASFIVRSVSPPIPVIAGPSSICNGGIAELTLDQPYTNYLWSTGDTTQTIMVDQPGIVPSYGLQ